MTIDERETWGTCAVCGARPGQSCLQDAAVSFGIGSDGKPRHIGAHLPRVRAAGLGLIAHQDGKRTALRAAVATVARNDDPTRYDDVMRILDRGATEQELADAAAVLAAPIIDKQGCLF
jgi:hypothetical protein